MEISVCMIVRNEATHLQRILPIVLQFADQLVIVDTGSTDETIGVARMFTDTVYTFEWSNDFAAARNFSFAKATSDYIMWLDADDYISPHDVQKILALKSTSNPADVYMMKYATSFDQNGNPTFTFFRERLLRTSGNYTWSGFVHEAITPRGRVEYTDILIQHRKTTPSNPKRNISLYRYHKRLGKIFCPREQYYYAKELYYNGYYYTAIRELKKYLRLPDKFAPNHYDAILTLSRCYNYKKNYQSAINIITDFAKTNTLNSELCCELGLSYIQSNRTLDAIMAYQSALCTHPSTYSGAFVEQNYYYLMIN